MIAMSGLGAVYLFWIGLLIAMESDTLYIHIKNKGSSLFATWFAALVIKSNLVMGIDSWVLLQ